MMLDKNVSQREMAKVLGMPETSFRQLMSFQKVSQELWDKVQDMSKVKSRTAAYIYSECEKNPSTLNIFMNVASKIRNGYGVDKQNLTDSYSKTRNNTNSMRKEKIDFYPSEKFPWTDISFKNLVRKKRQGSKKAKISASQPYCKIFHTKSKKICGNKEP